MSSPEIMTLDWLEEFREEIYELGEFLFIISIAVLIYYFFNMSL